MGLESGEARTALSFCGNQCAPTITTPPEDPVKKQREEEVKPAIEAPEVPAHSGSPSPSPIIKKSKQDKRIGKRSRKTLNPREHIQAARDLFATKEAKAHIANQGVINLIAEIDEVGTTTHDEWYGDLRDTAPSLDEWYDHVKATPSTKVSDEETK